MTGAELREEVNNVCLTFDHKEETYKEMYALTEKILERSEYTEEALKTKGLSEDLEFLSTLNGVMASVYSEMSSRCTHNAIIFRP